MNNKINFDQSIKIGRNVFKLYELFILKPVKYECIKVFNTPLNEDTYYFFIINERKVITQRTNLLVIANEAKTNIPIRIITSLKYAAYFYKSAIIILRGKFKDSTCYYPIIVTTVNNEIIPIYESLSSDKAVEIVNQLSHYLPEYAGAFRKIHTPVNEIDINIGFQELFHLEISILKNICKQGILYRDPMLKDYKYSLPFQLTTDQQNTITEIYKDLESEKRSIRLIYGEVGSGKSIIAFLSALKVIINEKDVYIMAPTSLLASQLYNNFIALFPDISCILVESKSKKKIQTKSPTIYIGTTVLLFRNISSNLGLLIVDEQHRFGVNQRNALLDQYTDLIMMTATPIPRTLNMIYQDTIKYSELKDKPSPNTYKTQIVKPDRIEDLYKWIINLSKEQKIIWICNSIAIAEQKYEMFKQHTNALLLHSKIKGKSDILNNFNVGVLVSTTVIEVGIDINCLYIVIEDADQFGLAQIHQLRGRVARHGGVGTCILIGSNIAKLKSIQEASDGFQISNMDLQRRGSGMIHSIQQSGESSFFFNYKYSNNKIIMYDAYQDIHIPISAEVINKYAPLFMYSSDLNLLY